MILASWADPRELFELWCARHAGGTDVGDGVVRCKILGWADCYVHGAEWGQARWYIRDGYWESWISVVMAQVFRPGDYVLDVGACYGYYTLLAAGQVGEEGHVTAAEASPELQGLLRRTIDENRLAGRVTVEPRIVWSRSEEDREIRIFDRNNVGASSAERTGPAAAVYTLPTVTVDDICRDWPRVDVVKIDVEGAEYEVWKGMRTTVARHQPTILVEFNPDYADPVGFLAEIREAGYNIATITPRAELVDITDAEILAQRELIYLLLEAESRS